MLHACVKDSMWRGIWKILQNFLGTKLGLDAVQGASRAIRWSCQRARPAGSQFSHRLTALYTLLTDPCVSRPSSHLLIRVHMHCNSQEQAEIHPRTLTRAHCRFDGIARASCSWSERWSPLSFTSLAWIYLTGNKHIWNALTEAAIYWLGA
jgi:hypothetical protein